MISETQYCFVSALVLATHLQALPPEQRGADLAIVEACQEKLHRWQRHCPANFRGRYALISAEVARLHGRDLDAIAHLYEEAIAAARRSGFVHDEAISFERAATFYQARGFASLAAASFREARASYLRWGAHAKVQDLDRKYPQMAEEPSSEPTAAVSVRSENLDFASVLKASQTISSEIVLEDLVRTLLQIVLQEGGARRVCLLVPKEGRLHVEAEAVLSAESVRTTLLQSIPLESAPFIPASLVESVLRSKERVILDDAALPTPFSSDPYFARRRTRSVLSLPILRQAEVVGILFLENDLTAGAFTADRLTALTLLASQAAISIDNARLLEQERSVRASAEAAERRSLFLAQASALLSESLAYDTTLARLGELCVASLADWCVVDLVEGAEVRRVARAHADPSKDILLKELQERHPSTWRSPHPAAASLRSGKPVLLTEVTEETLRSVCEDDDHRRLVRALGGASALAIPIVAHGKVLGALTLSSATPRRYGREDLALMREVADRAAIAIENSRLYGETQRAVKLRDDFLVVAAHELRTPLTALNLSLQDLKRAANRSDSRPVSLDRSVTRAAGQGQRLQRLIADLLDISRIQAGKLSLHLADNDLLQLAYNVVGQMEPMLAAAGCRVTVRCASPVGGRWDASRLEQVIANLLSNAMKFGAGKPIEIDIGRQGATAFLAVHDHGIGIPPSEQARIFEQFGRAVSSEYYGGLGLGLFISRRIAQAHGGTLEVASEPGEGSIFTLGLPFSPAIPLQDGVSEIEAEAPNAQTKP